MPHSGIVIFEIVYAHRGIVKFPDLRQIVIVKPINPVHDPRFAGINIDALCKPELLHSPMTGDLILRSVYRPVSVCPGIALAVKILRNAAQKPIAKEVQFVIMSLHRPLMPAKFIAKPAVHFHGYVIIRNSAGNTAFGAEVDPVIPVFS